MTTQIHFECKGAEEKEERGQICPPAGWAAGEECRERGNPDADQTGVRALVQRQGAQDKGKVNTQGCAWLDSGAASSTLSSE